MDNIKVYFQLAYGKVGFNIFVTREYAGKREFLTGDFRTWRPESSISGQEEPTAYFPPDVYEAFVKAIFAREKPTNSTFVEGKLEATEKHLEDMRDIVFKDFPKTIINVEAKQQ